MTKKKAPKPMKLVTVTQLFSAQGNRGVSEGDNASSSPNRQELDDASMALCFSPPASAGGDEAFCRDHMFGNPTDSEICDDLLDAENVCPRHVSLEGGKGSLLDCKPSSDVEAAQNPSHEEASLLPPNEDTSSSWVAAASLSSLLSADGVATAPFKPATESTTACRNDCGTCQLKPNPYKTLKRSSSIPPAANSAVAGASDAKKQRTEAPESGEKPDPSSSRLESASSDIHAVRAALPPVPGQHQSSSPATTSAKVIMATTRSRCQVIGASPQSEPPLMEGRDVFTVAELFEAMQVKVGGKRYAMSLEPRRQTFIKHEYKVGDTYKCIVEKKRKPAKDGTPTNKEAGSLSSRYFTIRAFFMKDSEECVVVEERMELRNTFLSADFDPISNEEWMARYGSDYVLSGKRKGILLRCLKQKFKVDSFPVTNVCHSGICAGQNLNLVYAIRSVSAPTVVDRTPSRVPVALELFAGGGGMSIGLKDAGFDVKYMVEVKQYFADTLRSNFGAAGSQVYQEDVRHFLENVRNGVPGYPRRGEVDHIHASSPCQGFSKENRNGGKNDIPNNELSKTFVTAVKALGPTTASFENVDGMLKKSNVSYLHEILWELLLAGYQFRLCLLTSSNYSVPQTRARLFILASKQGCPLPCKPAPTAPITVSDALHDLEGVQPMPLTGLVRLPDGKRVLHHNIEGTEVKSNLKHLSQYANGFTSALTKTEPLKHYAPSLNRLLTVRELARLQTFPDEHIFSGSLRDMKAQVGNAVPCELARSVAACIMECHKNELDP